MMIFDFKRKGYLEVGGPAGEWMPFVECYPFNIAKASIR